ncbi:MAG: hypothetical protein ACFE9L_07160 [Candidatus Hodarchaeota archaeon]
MYEQESDDLRTIKALPLWQSFLAAILAPVIIVVVFGILGSKTNAVLFQLEMILVAIAFCLTGILTRSKLLGLLNLIAAPISWFILFLIDIILGGFIPNPYGLLTGLAGPITAIAQSGILSGLGADLDQIVTLITQIAIILDLIIVEFLAFFLGFFLSTLATGIWTKKGKLSIFSLIIKPFAAVFAIIIILIVPFAYHGIANFADGGISIGAGAAEFLAFFGGELGGTGGSGAQAGGPSLDLNNPEVVANLTAAAENAAFWFKRSSTAFGQVQGNFLIRALLNYWFPEGSSYNGLNMREIPSLLSISDILYHLSDELPPLLAGYQNLANGFEITFGVLGQSSIGGGSGSSIEGITTDYDPTFTVGLNNISMALDNFTDAEEGVREALVTAEEIMTKVIVDETAELGIFVDIVDEAKAGYGVLIDVARGGIYFLNATYKTTLAVDEMGESDFLGANNYMNGAANDLVTASSTLQAIDLSGLDPNSPLPFYGTVKIVQDMTQLLSYFSIAAANGTSCYLAVEKGLNALNGIKFTEGTGLSTGFNDAATNISAANSFFDSAADNMNDASSFSNNLTNPENTYGPIIDGSLKPMLNDFSYMINQFSTNITELGYQLRALEHTLFAMQSFSVGVTLYNQTWNFEYAEAGGSGPAFLAGFTSNTTVLDANDTLQLAIANASLGWYNLSLATKIPNEVRTSWQNLLFWVSPLGGGPTSPYPAPPVTYIPSIAGLARGVQEAITTLWFLGEAAQMNPENVLVQLFYDNMDTIGLGTIFGGGP